MTKHTTSEEPQFLDELGKMLWNAADRLPPFAFPPLVSSPSASSSADQQFLDDLGRRISRYMEINSLN